MNKEFKKILQNKYPQIFDKNEEFIISECEMIYRIDISCCSIKVIDGLDIFTNLQTLNCHNNQLTSLDVQGLTNLQTLYCNNNQIASLNVQGLVKLKNLVCQHNQLTSLNVQGLANLQKLYCYNSQLTSLNVQGLANLQTLHCEDNQLTALDVQGLTKLETLVCGNNQLKSLNVQGLTNLQTLNCDKSIQLDVKFVFNTSNYCAFLMSENDIRCGCFWGTYQEFIEAVLSKYEKDCAYYKWAISL